MRALNTAAGASLSSGSFQEVLAGRQLIPVVTLRDAADARPLTAALAEGGLGCLEITFRTPAAADAIAAAAEFGDVVVGAGTVTSRTQVEVATQAGAAFVVSPGYVDSVAECCAGLGVPYLPGVATPTELIAARANGYQVVKLFPAEPLGGLPLLKALAALFEDMRFVPTGGIDRDRAAGYLSHPAVLAVGGSWMVPHDAVEGRDWSRIRELARDAGQQRQATSSSTSRR